MKYLTLASACFFICSSAPSATLFYVSDLGYLTAFSNEEILDPVTAVRALASPPDPVAAGQKLSSAIPAATEVLSVVSDGQTVTVEFSQAIIGEGLDDGRLEQIFNQVRATLQSFEIGDSVRLQTAGRLLSDYLPPKPIIEPRRIPKTANLTGEVGAAAAGALAGKSISLSPGHGKVWNGSTYVFERPVYCAPLNCEDDHNLEIMNYLDLYLRQDGAVTRPYRSLSKAGTHTPSGEPWWRVSASYWLKQLGYPCSVYASYTGDCNLNTGSSESSDSLRSRGLASDYDNTDIYVSLHSNGSSGYCVGAGCPNGTCTYYDTSSEHATWGAISRTLASKVNTAIVDAVRTKYNDTTWRDRGSLDAAGSQAETRIPNRAAILIELAFHDTCDRDGLYLRDNWFRSLSMWATYKGICGYFGVTPTWDFYSCEIVSDTIPATMTPGSSVTAQITVRNRGVLWNDARSFRLGAVGDSDPFTTTTRYNVGGEINPGSTRTFLVTLKAPATLGTYTTDWRMVRDGVGWFGPSLSRQILVSQTGDTEPPTVPSGLVATPVSPSQVDLRWNPATDNTAVGSYRIYRDSALLATSSTTNYSDTACLSMTTYNYRVSALDFSGNESALSSIVAATTLPQLEFIIDNPQGTTSGAWTTSTSSSDKYMSDYQWTATSDTPSAQFRWTPRIERAGFYNVAIWYPVGANRCTNSPFTIRFAGGSVTVPINQTANGGQWVSLGASRPFITGTNGNVQLSNGTTEPAKVVMADAVRFTYASALPSLPAIQASIQGNVPVLTWANSYCVLQESPSLSTGAWTDVIGATSPFPVNTSASPIKFYRLRY